jgi:hypothetical protein
MGKPLAKTDPARPAKRPIRFGLLAGQVSISDDFDASLSCVEAGSADDRHAARISQLLIDHERLIRHQQLAIDLLLMPRGQSKDLVQRARNEVARWRRDRLCSDDHSDRWDQLLDMTVKDLARAMCSDSQGWGKALRQNSPWPAVVPFTAPV